MASQLQGRGEGKAMRVQSAKGRKAAVACGHALAKEAALGVFADGGGVADAAVAGAVALNVVLPQACSLGGDCFILAHAGGKTHGINGSGPSPQRLPPAATAEQLVNGPLSCAVPGALGALEALHRKFGKLSWKRVVAPAIALARDGIPVGRDLARGMQENLARLAADPGSHALFLDNGRPQTEGSRLRQPAMARTLETIAADGAAAFYRGPLGKRLCDTVAARGGVLHLSDLEAYAPLWVEPLETRYRGYTVRAMPPNSYGAIMLMQLAALDGCDLAALPAESAERLRLLIVAARESFRLGRRFIADPTVVGAAVGKLLSPDTIGEIQTELRADVRRPAAATHGHGTAVISVADDKGEGVAIVQSIFAPFGALVSDPATGFVLNNRLMGFSVRPGDINAPAPGKRPAHTLNPGMAFDGDRLAFVLTTPGGSGQTITLTQVLSNRVDLGMPLDQAIDAPRWSMDLKGNFTLEDAFGPATIEALAARGIEARIAAPAQRFFFGSAECVEVARDGTLTAAADYRREAAAGAI
jgi:gamma-glutamyltranspeptidase/glutathione hydrolase